MFGRVSSSTAIPSASTTVTVPDLRPISSRTASHVEVVFTMIVPVGASPAATFPERASASWKTATTCGLSTGLLVRISRSGAQKRRNDLTGVPFFSDP